LKYGKAIFLGAYLNSSSDLDLCPPFLACQFKLLQFSQSIPNKHKHAVERPPAEEVSAAVLQHYNITSAEKEEEAHSEASLTADTHTHIEMGVEVRSP
jgi:hypothetical protein